MMQQRVDTGSSLLPSCSNRAYLSRHPFLGSVSTYVPRVNTVPYRTDRTVWHLLLGLKRLGIKTPLRNSTSPVTVYKRA
jgi:hypothetical protein